MTLFELRRALLCFLDEAEVEDAASISRYLICDIMNITTTQMMLADRDEVDPAVAEHIMECARRLADSEPLQYITHKAYFCGHTFWVDSGVLIPRPETELLVDKASSFVAEAGSQRLLDIGTGSGCIAISIKDKVPTLHVTAIDVSEYAVAIAQRNASDMHADIDFQLADIFADVTSLGSFDVVVSNPPYVCNREKADMKPNVLLHEPHLALFVPDDDPLLYYRRIAQLCKSGLLNPNGALFFEINEAYSEETMQMLQYEGFKDVGRQMDDYGKWRLCWGKL